jgi:HEPN domain-containing protein
LSLRFPAQWPGKVNCSMNDETRAEAAAWLSKAGGDLRAAEILSAPENDQGAAAVYHCQQAAEKAVKALLVYRETPFPKTHDIERLVEMVNEAAMRMG